MPLQVSFIDTLSWTIRKRAETTHVALRSSLATTLQGLTRADVRIPVQRVFHP